METPGAILIAGPTASGKSALALRHAEAHNGVILNADSMQVYGDLSVLTARPSPQNEVKVPHRLYGHVDGAAGYSVARWLDNIKCELTDARATGQTPVIVGGTGLYFKALLEGLSPVPDIPDEIREKWRTAKLADESVDLHAELAARDPLGAAELRPTDRQRLVRALEVVEATGTPLGEWQQMPGTPLLHADECRRLVIAPGRETLYARCDARFDQMLVGGAVEEVEALLARQLPDDRSVLRALGVGPIAEMLSGQATREDAADRAKTDTRRYAKRQLTWARGHMADWEWLEH